MKYRNLLIFTLISIIYAGDPPIPCPNGTYRNEDTICLQCKSNCQEIKNNNVWVEICKDFCPVNIDYPQTSINPLIPGKIETQVQNQHYLWLLLAIPIILAVIIVYLVVRWIKKNSNPRPIVPPISMCNGSNPQIYDLPDNPLLVEIVGSNNALNTSEHSIPDIPSIHSIPSTHSYRSIDLPVGPPDSPTHEISCSSGSLDITKLVIPTDAIIRDNLGEIVGLHTVLNRSTHSINCIPSTHSYRPINLPVGPPNPTTHDSPNASMPFIPSDEQEESDNYGGVVGSHTWAALVPATNLDDREEPDNRVDVQQK